MSIGTPDFGTATIITNAGVPWKIYYTPASLTATDTTTFTYTVDDGFGGTATANITIDVIPVYGQATDIQVNGSSVTISFAGIPGFVYTVERNTNSPLGADFVPGPGYSNYDITAPSNGLFQYTDNFDDIGGPPSGQAYWRLKVTP